MKVLHLTLKKKWFDMSDSGEKKEEYREIKQYWWKRLVQCGQCYAYPEIYEWDSDTLLPVDQWKMLLPKNFDAVTATNGYGKQRPSWTRKFEGIEIREGRTEWGAEPGKIYFVIKLGEKI